MSNLGPNEPTQSDIEHAHGSVVHSHGIIGAGLHSHPGIPGEPEYDFFALVASEEQLAEQVRRSKEGHRRYLEKENARLRRLIFAEIDHERDRQDRRWGSVHDDEHDEKDWARFIRARVDELGGKREPALRLFTEIAALAVAAMESAHRRRRP
ncbi:MAG: hypothetical protein ACRDIC_06015 [bacterium]